MTRYKAKACYTETKEVDFEFDLNGDDYHNDKFGARDQAWDILMDDMDIYSVEELEVEEIK